MSKPRYRLAVDAALATGAAVTLRDNAAHYLSTVLRLGVGETVTVFNRADGEWQARIADMRKKEMTLTVESCMRAPSPSGMKLMVCFAPIKGGRMETIIEKATELGASVLQPVITQRTIVDKVNIARAEAIAREAAEQCERIDWPEIREPVKLLNLLGDWPADMPLIYGDESGGSGSIIEALIKQSRLPRVGGKEPPSMNTKQWAVLAGPEGGFTPDEFAALGRVKAALGVGLGPRILRADTAVITLCVATLMAWGDWDERPRFVASGN
jgi:16S rRNA (uracil1498-N3)-methyltransferase